MKRTSIFLLFCLFLLPTKVAAAELGLPSFVSLNDVVIERDTPTFNFFLPQPLDPTKQYQQDSLIFAVETEELSSVIPADILTRATYTWQFGDGTKGEGKEIIHSYTNPGSYRVSVTVSVPVDVIATPTNYTQSWILTIIPKPIQYSDNGINNLLPQGIYESSSLSLRDHVMAKQSL